MKTPARAQAFFFTIQKNLLVQEKNLAQKASSRDIYSGDERGRGQIRSSPRSFTVNPHTISRSVDADVESRGVQCGL